MEYPFEIRPLYADDGGGFLISYPDFSDCISDGTTGEDAIFNGRNALKFTIAALKAKALLFPRPMGEVSLAESLSPACQSAF